MSFGVGFGDIAKAIALAKDVVTRYREAPRHVKDLATEISARLTVLETAGHALHQRHDKSQSAALRPVLDGYMELLDRFEKMYDANHELASPGSGVRNKTRVFGKRLMLDSNEIKRCREQLGHYNGMLDCIMTSLSVTTMEDAHQSKEHERLLDWLTPPALDSSFGKIHTERLRKRVDNTGEWFPQLEQFRTFIRNPQTTLLCLGIPGAGKSILCSVAIHHLQQIQADQLSESIGVGYLLFDFKSKYTSSPEDIIACLLGQLVRQWKAPPDLKQLFRVYQLKPKDSRPLMNELVGCLKTIISLYSRTFVAIDALDEYDVGRVKFLDQLFQVQESTNLNIVATLRPIQEITSLFEESGIEESKLLRIQIDAKDEDIRRFLHRWMAENMLFLRRVPKEEKDQLIAKICEASTGMFLLAVLYLQSLAECQTLASVRKKITSFPKGEKAYDLLYADTMKRIANSKYRELAMCILSWAGWAKRPLIVRELQHALAVKDEELVLDRDNTISVEVIVSVCKGLVTVDPHTEIVRLIHYTTREYLESVAQDMFPIAECDIVDTCLSLMSSSQFASGRCQTDDEYQARLEKYPLYDYAVKNWGLHARLLASLKVGDVLGFLQSKPNVAAASQCLFAWRTYGLSTPTEVTGLHLAVWFGLKTITEEMLSKGYYNANERDTYGQSALALATSRGFLGVLQVLLAYTAEVESTDSWGRTPLSQAAERGDIEMVKVLMAHGADPSSRDEFGRSPLSFAAESGSEATVRHMVRHASIASAINRRSSGGKTPLWYAATGNHWGIVKLLMDHNANPNVQQSSGHTLITDRVTTKGDQREAVAKLIEFGADVNLADTSGCTGLSYACQQSQLDMTNLLLSSGADQTIADRDGWTPLMWATDSGWKDGVETLLNHDNGCCLARQDRYGQTALSIASRMGFKDVVEVLLEWDTEMKTINLADKTGWTPLIQAAKSSSEILALILDKTSDAVNAGRKDCAGKTALHWAAMHGNLRAARILIGVSEVGVEARDDLERTPLWLAASHGHETVVTVLLQSGADVNAVDRFTRTPLRIAAERRHDKVVKELLSCNGKLEINPALCNSIQQLVCFTASLEVRNLMSEVQPACGPREGGVFMAHDDGFDILGLVALFC